MNLLTEIQNDANGALMLKEWLGDGMTPVPQEKAEFRAQICAFGIKGKACAANIAPNWWDKVKGAIADTIKIHLFVKKKAAIAVSCEDHLNMCQICGCCLSLKVHVPIEHVKNHTSKRVMTKLPSYCWIRKEIEV